MSVKQKQLVEYALQDIIALLMERKGLALKEAMEIAYHSALYGKLQDIGTGLYLEGSEYLYNLLSEELDGGDRTARPVHA